MPKSHCPKPSGRFGWPFATPQIMAMGFHRPCTLAVNLPFMYLLNGTFPVAVSTLPALDLHSYSYTYTLVWVRCCHIREVYITLTVCSAWYIAPWIFYYSIHHCLMCTHSAEGMLYVYVHASSECVHIMHSLRVSQCNPDCMCCILFSELSKLHLCSDGNACTEMIKCWQTT